MLNFSFKGAYIVWGTVYSVTRDRDHPSNDYTIMNKGAGKSKEAKEVHNRVRNVLKQSNSVLDSSSQKWHSLGCRFEQALEGIIFLHAPL